MTAAFVDKKKKWYLEYFADCVYLKMLIEYFLLKLLKVEIVIKWMVHADINTFVDSKIETIELLLFYGYSPTTFYEITN